MIRAYGDWILSRELEGDIGDELVIRLYNDSKVKRIELLDFGPRSNLGGEYMVGDIVIVEKRTGVLVRHEGERYELCKEHNFLIKEISR